MRMRDWSSDGCSSDLNRRRRVDRRRGVASLTAGVDLEVEVGAGAAGVAGVADVASDGAGVDRSGDRSVAVEMRAVVVVAVVSPEVERGPTDAVRAVLDGPINRRDDRCAPTGKHVDTLVRPAARPRRSP